MSFQKLINGDDLQHLQDEFCRVMEIYARCVDENRNPLTYVTGPLGGTAEGEPFFQGEAMQAAMERVEQGSLEDQAVEEFAEGRAAAIAIRIEGNTVLYCQVLDLTGRERESFYQILDLLRDVYGLIHIGKAPYFDKTAESQGSRSTEQEMNETIHTLESAMEIVRLLDWDGRIEQIMQKWLESLAKYIRVDTAELFRLSEKNNTMDVICEWCEKGRISFFDQTNKVPSYRFLFTDKPLIISSDSTDSEYYRDVEAIGMTAVILFPVLKREDESDVILSLNYRKKKHIWTAQEIKFTEGAVKVLQSILKRRSQKSKLDGSYQVMEAILDSVGCPLYVTKDWDGEVIFANKKLQTAFAKELRDGTLRKLVQQEGSRSEEGGSYEIFYEEQERWYDLKYQQIPWIDGSRGVLYSLYDITDKKLYQRKIEQQAYTDFLTGLYNRMCFERDLARQIDEAKRDGTKGALVYLDLDDFKHINDALGHQYGDVLLKDISQSLRRIRGIENTCYRMGGDEFVIIVSPMTFAYFDEIVEEIRSIFSKPWFLKDTDYYCTTSMGIVTFPDAGDSVVDLIKKADIAMYEAKKGGKNRLAQYDESHTSGSGRRLDMEKNMRDAAVEGCREFEVYYQPIIDIQSNGKKCAGAEALIRWNSTKLGFIPPSEFIPLAEYLGLINPIGNYVLEEACRHCREWNKKGHPDYKVNVNLSVVQLLQTDIVEIVESTLQKTKLNPKNLTLEVTESLAINDMTRMKEILNRIKALGVSLALDDFGTGYSSLNHIREIPIDVIKVDQSFVKGLAEDVYSQAFIKMVAELAQTIGVNICVEGIETDAQYRVLQDMKVKYIQGFYFDRPMPREQFEEKYIK